MCWKFLQAILHQQYAIELSSPKAIFRECFTHQIIGQTETQELLDMAEARNATTHNYNEETAKEICKRITHYFEIFKQLDKLGI